MCHVFPHVRCPSFSLTSHLSSQVEFSLSITFPPGCIKVDYRSLDGYMKLDTHTVRSLELVECRDTSASSKDKKKFVSTCSLPVHHLCVPIFEPLTPTLTYLSYYNRSSLFGAMNATKTPQGARLLRQMLLQPLADISMYTFTTVYMCAVVHSLPSHIVPSLLPPLSPSNDQHPS